jgi:hypothetical protein
MGISEHGGKTLDLLDQLGRYEFASKLLDDEGNRSLSSMPSTWREF